MPTIAIAVSPEWALCIKASAEELDVTQAEVVRMALEASGACPPGPPKEAKGEAKRRRHQAQVLKALAKGPQRRYGLLKLVTCDYYCVTYALEALVAAGEVSLDPTTRIYSLAQRTGEKDLAYNNAPS